MENNLTYRRICCRLCDSLKLELALPIPPTPVADKYLSPDQVSEDCEKVSLDLYRCQHCGHVQLLTGVAPSILWSNYKFQTGRTKGLVKHYGQMAEEIVKIYLQNEDGYVLDIGSNDGTFLAQFQSRGFTVLGVDPAREVAEQAIASGIPTIVDYMTPGLATRLLGEHGHAQAITATNVFAHADDLLGMLEAVRVLMAPDGIFVFEASYLTDILEKNLIGTIFHEHLSYHAVGPLIQFFQRKNMELITVQRNKIQGGSIVGVACHKKNKNLVCDASVEALVIEENERGINNGEAIRGFADGIANARDKIHSVLGPEGRLVGFGSAISATTFLAVYDLCNRIDFIVDDNPDKQNKLTAGHHIRVLPVEELYNQMPMMTVILAWIHTSRVLASHRRYVDEGGVFLTLHPEIKIIDKNNYDEVCRLWA